MAQGEFTKEEADSVTEAFKEIFDALPRTKKMIFLGHANDIYLFLSAAKAAAPEGESDAGSENHSTGG